MLTHENKSVRRIHDVLNHYAEKTPDSDAVVEIDRRYTYGQLREAVDDTAKALLAKGVKRGDRVGQLAPPSIDFWIMLLAATSIGAIWVGINPKYQKREQEYLLNNAKPGLLVVNSPLDEMDFSTALQHVESPVQTFVVIGEPTEDAISWDRFIWDGQSVDDAQLASARNSVDPEDTAVIVYTSGTTGNPKGAMLSHRAIVWTGITNVERLRDGLQCVICPAPINHIGCINNICFNVFAYGGKIAFVPKVDLEMIAALTVSEHPTYLVSSPTAFMMMLSNPQFNIEVLSIYSAIVFGGAATPESILEKIAFCGARMASVYGLTESTGIITHTDETATLKEMAETIGKPLNGVELRLVDGDNLPVADGETGEIQVRGPFTMSGYFKMPEATADTFTTDGFLKTGDLGKMRPDGNIEFVGRLKEMFKSGGYNIYPLEIEAAICEHPDVLNAVVMPVPHEMFQEVGHAFVEPVPGRRIDENGLRHFLKKNIANYKVPKTFAFMETLPKLPNSKVDKQALKKLLQTDQIL